MSNLEQTYQRFLEEVNRPEKRKKELTAQWQKLKGQESQAREAFSQAEAKGLESENSLTTTKGYQRARINRS